MPHSDDAPPWSLGLMSGTSLDGIDAALIRTDGETVSAFGPWMTVPMEPRLRERLKLAMQGEGDMPLLERDITRLHALAVKELLANADIPASEVQVIGFHGQTIAHRPEEGITWQLGNGALLAELTGIDVICDFRRRDMAAGGQGAPLVPLFHAAITHALPKPLAVLNIGGVANVTYISPSLRAGGEAIQASASGALNYFAGARNDETILAFDTGPGNAMLNDWCQRHTGQAYDRDGALALVGRVDEVLMQEFLAHPYFLKKPPKSLDRNAFSLEPFARLSAEDGAATLTECMAQSVKMAQMHFPQKPAHWYICGGGRHNPAMMKSLSHLLGPVQPVEQIGLQGDALEAQAFAYLAVRSLKKLPLTLPSTTGAMRAVTGGAHYSGNSVNYKMY